MDIWEEQQMGKEARLTRPTRRQKMVIKQNKLDPGTWLVQHDDGLQITIVSKKKGQVRNLQVGGTS